MATRRFAQSDEPAPISSIHALALANTAYSMLKDGNASAAERILGILIGYLKGNGEEI